MRSRPPVSGDALLELIDSTSCECLAVALARRHDVLDELDEADVHDGLDNNLVRSHPPGSGDALLKRLLTQAIASMNVIWCDFDVKFSKTGFLLDPGATGVILTSNFQKPVFLLSRELLLRHAAVLIQS